MNFNLDLIGGILINALVSAEKAPVLAFLQSIHDKDSDEYKALIFAANYGIKKAKTATDKTTTKLDDEALAAIQDILKSSADANGITL